MYSCFVQNHPRAEVIWCPQDKARQKRLVSYRTVISCISWCMCGRALSHCTGVARIMWMPQHSTHTHTHTVTCCAACHNAALHCTGHPARLNRPATTLRAHPPRPQTTQHLCHRQHTSGHPSPNTPSSLSQHPAALITLHHTRRGRQGTATCIAGTKKLHNRTLLYTIGHTNH